MTPILRPIIAPNGVAAKTTYIAKDCCELKNAWASNTKGRKSTLNHNIAYDA